MAWPSGPNRPETRRKARRLLDDGDVDAALRILAGACDGTPVDTDYYRLLGEALLASGQPLNAGRFLFFAPPWTPPEQDAVDAFLKRNHDEGNHRQLHSQMPMRLRQASTLRAFPDEVAQRLRQLGWPDTW